MAVILLVDDDEQVLFVLRQFLERAGFEVLDAQDGKAALAIYKREKVDLVITDIFMPKKEGIETIIEIKRDFPETKIIAISGGGRLDSDPFLRAAKKFGADRTLHKPVTRDELLQSVREVLT